MLLATLRFYRRATAPGVSGRSGLAVIEALEAQSKPGYVFVLARRMG